ncbi:unnamed protein product, partial [Nesidiocoris tenuis]
MFQYHCYRAKPYNKVGKGFPHCQSERGTTTTTTTTTKSLILHEQLLKSVKYVNPSETISSPSRDFFKSLRYSTRSWETAGTIGYRHRARFGNRGGTEVIENPFKSKSLPICW